MTFRHGHDRRDYSPDAAGMTDPGRAWEVEVRQSYHQPLAAGRSVYLVSHSWGSDDTNVFAHGAAALDRTWGYRSPFSAGPPTLADGAVLVGTEEGVAAADAGDGTELWTSDESVAGESPVAVSGDVVVATGTGATRAFVTGLDLATGESRWRTAIPRPDGAPAVDGERAVVRHGYGEETVETTVFDPTSGRKRRTFETPRGPGPPVLDGSYLLAGGFHGVAAYDATSGDRHWSTAVDDVVGSPALTDDLVVAATDYRVVALDRETGADVWEVETDGEPLAPPVVADDTVYVPGGSGEEGFVAALAHATGERRYVLSLPKPVGSVPALLDGGLLVATRDDVAGDDEEYVALFLDGR